MTKLASLFIILFIAIGQLSAHEVSTHRNIGDAALVYLAKQFPDRPTLNDSSRLLGIGAVQEDNAPLPGAELPYGLGRYYFHFDPQLIYAVPPLLLSASCSSIQWGISGSSCSANCSYLLVAVPFLCNGVWQGTNGYAWPNNLVGDATGVPTTSSLTGFGYVVHLLEDLGSPPHTRNDPHPCPIGTLGGLGPYCDLFETSNDGASPQNSPGWNDFVNSDPIIPTDGFTTPQQFFDALQQYVAANYYSGNTIGQRRRIPVPFSPDGAALAAGLS